MVVTMTIVITQQVQHCIHLGTDPAAHQRSIGRPKLDFRDSYTQRFAVSVTYQGVY